MPPTTSSHSAAGSASEPTSFLCAFCSMELYSLSITQREAHYEYHLTNNSAVQPEDLGSRLAPIDLECIPNSSNFLRTHPVHSNAKGPSSKKFRFGRGSDSFWHPGLEAPPPHSHVPGLIHVLRKGLVKGHDRGIVRRAALCVDNAVLIHREIWDATWGCGYRNFLMACAALMNQKKQPGYFSLLDSPIPPSVYNLQSWIEMAWTEGFDVEGKKDLQKLIDTRKWIGTADIWVAFVSRRIPAQLVDFDLRNKSQDILINWVVEYFTPKESQGRPSNAFDSLNESPIIITEKMPLILQHDGHSRTVVGYEIDRKGMTNLLVFDPAYSPRPEIRNVALADYSKSNSVPQVPSSATSTTEFPTPSVLKRKRSVGVSSLNERQPASGETSKAMPSKSPARILSPLKIGLSKAGIGHHKTDLDVYEIVKKFRLEPKKLEKKKQYQILYFTMGAPLSENERMQKKQVTSIKIS